MYYTWMLEQLLLWMVGISTVFTREYVGHVEEEGCEGDGLEKKFMRKVLGMHPGKVNISHKILM